MEYRNYKGTDQKISLLGLGCMRFDLMDNNHSAIDHEKAEKIIDLAYKSGINYFDSAYVYNNGDSELIMGKALRKYPRESYYLATKLPGWTKFNSKNDVLKIFNEQLNRLQVDYIDFYLCHNLNEGTVENFSQDFVFAALIELKEAGKIGKLGFSSHADPETLKQFASLRSWDFAQIQLNYLDWEYLDAKAQYNILTELDIPVVVMEPVRGGRLASLDPELDKTLRDFRPDNSVASWAIRFAASLPNVMTVLSGMNKLEQVEDNVKSMSPFIPLSDEEQNVLLQATKTLIESTNIPCTACKYCVDGCPQSLDIPEILEAYNEYMISKSGRALSPLRELPSDKQPSSCVACLSCTEVCPQNIDIPGYLEKIAELLSSARPPRR